MIVEDKVKMTIYLAGPIAGCTDEECKGWRDKTKEALPEINCLDPMRRDYRDVDASGIHDAFTPEISKEIVEHDKADILASDVILVYHDKPSVGTSMETHFAFDNGIYVLVVHATGKPLSPWFQYHSDKVVQTLEEAYAHLKELSSNYGEYFTIGEEWEDAV